MEPSADLIDRARRGDRSAQQSLVEAYQARVFAVCTAMGGSDAEDLAQETLLRALTVLRTFDPRGPARLSTFVLRIARNLCIDRARSARARMTDDSDVDRLPGGVASHAQLISDGDAEHVRRAILALPADQRAAVVLRIWGELEYAEIAAIEGVPLGTIRSRLARARDALSDALAPEFANRKVVNDR